MASASCSAPSVAGGGGARAPRSGKLTCLCSPTDHPGSFRCSRHRNGPRGRAAAPAAPDREATRGKGRSVRALLLQRIGGPSDRDRQQRRRRGDFQPRPSRLRLMNM